MSAFRSPQLEEIREALGTTRAALGALVTRGGDRLERAPVGGGWSIAQVLEHLGRVEGSVAKMIELQLVPTAETLPPEGPPRPMLGILDGWSITDRSRRIEAPTPVAPGATPDGAAAWASLVGVRERLHRAYAAVDGRDLRGWQRPHPIFGPMDGYEWFLFLGHHEERHRQQVEALLDD